MKQWPPSSVAALASDDAIGGAAQRSLAGAHAARCRIAATPNRHSC
jgi:hypothetical protein